MKSKIIATSCLQCLANCGVLVEIKNGRIINIAGNPEDPNSRGKICVKGLVGSRQVYDPERITQPLERVGPRGGNQWKTISWEDAYRKIIGKMQKLKEKQSPQGFVFLSGRNMQEDYTKRFTHGFGSPNHFNHASICSVSKNTGNMATIGTMKLLADIANADFIILFGSNTLEAGVPFVAAAQRLIEAKDRGAKVVVVDPRMNKTGEFADQWIPITPGTDGALAMGMAHVLITEELFHKEFIDQWTTGFTELKKEIAFFPPDKVAAICDINAETIIQLARDFAKAPRAVADAGRGVYAHENATSSWRAILALNALKGNIDDVGGLCFAVNTSLKEVEPIPSVPDIPKIDLAGSSEFPLALNGFHQVLPQALKKEPHAIEVLMIYHGSPAYSVPEPQKQIEVLKNEEAIAFMVSIDPFMGETTAYADIVLPETTYLERYDLIASPNSLDFVPYLYIRQPVIEPLYECRSIKRILRDLAQGIGLGLEKYFIDTEIEYYKKRLQGIPQGPSWEELKGNGLWVSKEPRKTKNYLKQDFPTSSGKVEFTSQFLLDKGYKAITSFEAIRSHRDEKEKYPLYLITHKLVNHTQSRTANIPELMELQQENFVEINEETGRKLGIITGEIVKVSSSTGEVILSCNLTPSIHPQVVAISHHFGHINYGEIAKNKGCNANWIINCRQDPISAMVAFNDTLVKVEKIN